MKHLSAGIRPAGQFLFSIFCERRIPMRYALLVPCYEPDERVLKLTEELKKCLYADFYVVNDGSGPEFDHIFRKLEEMGCTVISYNENKGKGAALRTGIDIIRSSCESYSYILTADADGQHTPFDIRKVADAAEKAWMASLGCEKEKPLILGIRDFEEKDVPIKSRFGNRFSSLYFKYVTGVKLCDTQTGLRAIPDDLFALAAETPGDRYDYEMNFLIAAADRIRTVPIHTVYEEGNETSHFRTLRDSMLIYRTPLRYVTVSLISAAVDLTLFTVLSAVFGTMLGGILAATAAARIVSGVVNFSLNRKWAFTSIRSEEGKTGMQAIRYLTLFVTQMLASSLLVTLLAFLPLPLTFVKLVVDTCLAFFSYYMQHNWVFQSDSHLKKHQNEYGAVAKKKVS